MYPKTSDFLLGINRLSLALLHVLCTVKKSPLKNLKESEKRNKYCAIQDLNSLEFVFMAILPE